MTTGRRRAAAIAAGSAAVAIGLAVLVGWVAGVPGATNLLPGLASMKFNTALCAVLLGGAIALVVWRPTLRPVGVVIGAVVGVIGLATLVEYVAGVSLGLDEAIVRDVASSSTPGRMSVATAAAFSLGAGSLITLDSPRVRPAVSHGLAIGVLLISGIALLGYAYGVTELYSFGPYATIALHTAVAVLLIAIGLILGQPERGAMGWASDDTPGGLLVRRMLPITAGVPIILGFAVLLGARAGWYSTPFGLALLVVAIVVLLRVVVFRTATRLNALDRERARAISAAERLADEQRLVTDTIADGIVTIDARSRIEYVNAATERMFGYTAYELIGEPLTKLMPERYRQPHLNAFGRYVESGTRTIAWDGVELTGRHKDGHEFPVEVAFAEGHRDNERRFTGAIRDIGSRKRLEAQLLQAQRLESVGLLAGGIAHDFNNILTVILGFARLAIDEPLDADPERHKLRSIEDAATRASSLVDQLLAFSRQQVQRTEIIDLDEVLARLTGMLERLIGEDVEIDVRSSHDLWPIEADRSQLEQVVVNLAVNARDAMPRGGRLTIETSNVELDAGYVAKHADVRPGPHVLLTVSDTGAGMDSATQARIFEPFFTTKDAGRGTGLGLATVYGIVRQSGGHIWVYSEPGKGSAFRAYFPRATRAAEPAAPTTPRSKAARGTETVLVAEDEEVLRRLIEIVLGRLGYRVLLASNAPEAHEIAGREPIDLLLTDVVMPGGSGFDLAAQLHVRHPNLRVLFMSGYTAAALEPHGPRIDAERLVEKPFTPDGLGQAVRRALDGAV